MSNGLLRIGRAARLAVLCCAFALAAAPALAGSPPAMIVPGQFNVGSTGAFTYTIPIALPPGTGGMVPALSFDYSSQSGDGLEGLGWTLSGLPSIGRCPQTMAQDGAHGAVTYGANTTAPDRFCMAGQRLVAISGSYGANGTVYRTEVEGFSNIVSHGTSGSGPSYFTVQTKAGQTMYFGYAEDTDNPGNNSRLTLSASNPTARGWAVEKIADTVGNFLIVKYTNDMANGQAYPNEVDYTGNDAASLSPYASVKFLYNFTRADIVPTYQAGYLMQTTKLLSNVETYVGSTMITNYKLGYSFAGDGTQHDELTSVTECDGGSNCLAPTTFGWQGSRNILTMSTVPNGIGQGSSSFLGTLGAGDWNADGITDVETNASSSCDIFYGTLSSGFVESNIVANYTKWTLGDDGYEFSLYSGKPCFGKIPSPAKYVLSLAGDGLTDELLAQRNSKTSFYFSIIKNNGTGSMNEISWDSMETPVLLGDFNGDGRSDFIASVYAGLPLYTYYSLGNGSFNVSTTSIDPSLTLSGGDFDGDGCTDLLEQGSTNAFVYSCNPAVASFPVGNWSGNEIVLGDFNGDGKTDVLLANASGAGTLYLSTGTGLVAQSFAVPSGWGNFQIITGDWNGDGKTDIALIAAGNGGYTFGTDHEIWLSTGTGFVEAPFTIPNNNSADTVEQGFSADWNSDGAADIWLKKPSGDTEYLFAYVPELMTSVNNGLGVTTTVTYDRLNKNTPLYQKCSTPGTYICGDAWPTQDLDGPLYVVSRIDSSNGLGACVPPSMTNCYSSTYSYGGAQADLQGRGFLGFAQMSVTDLQTGIVQTTSYDTVFPYTGLIASQTKVCPVAVCTTGAVTLNSTTNTFGQLSLGTGTDGVKRVFVELQNTVVASNDLNGTAMPGVTTTYTYDCDTGSACAGTSPTGYGNAMTIATTVTDGSSKTTTNTYDNDTSNGHWYLGRLRTANVNSIVGSSNLTRQTSYTYDTGASTSTGLLKSEVVEPESSSDPSLKLETDYTYDSFGNKATATTKGCVWLSATNCSTTAGTASRETQTTFDAVTYHGQFATQITNALSQYETWAYAATNNTAFGVPSSHTGPNNLATSWIYDTFGRKTLETRPDGNETATGYYYCTAVPCTGLPSTITALPANTQFVVVVTPENSSGAQNGPIGVTYYDGLSRAVATDIEGFDAAGTGCTASAPCWIRAETQYDANGRAYRTNRPYFLAGGTAKWTTNTTYDALGRVTLVTFPDTSTLGKCYDGLTTSVTNAKNQIKTTVLNAQGLVGSVVESATAACGTSGSTTSYVYDAFGNLATVKDPAGNVTTNTYDIRGRKTQAADPDMGTWNYVYDGFGELYSQTDAKSQTTTLTYDALGRKLTRTEPDLSSTWVYDTASGKGIGQLASATTGSNYLRTYTYDTLGRPSTVTLTIDGTANTYTTNYNSDGRILTVAYPSTFTAQYNYTTLGYLYTVSDNGGTHQVFWTATSRDAELHLLTQTAGNSVVTTQTFDPNTGLVQSIVAGTGNTVANQSYDFDSLGNLTNRTWLNTAGASVNENMCYDSLNRLTGTLVTSGTGCTGTGAVAVSYDALGNITEKTDICATANCMAYGAGSAGPHALTSITGTYNGVSNPTFAYDANGSMTSGAGRTITTTSFNMAGSIADGGNTDTLTYDTEHARVKQVATGANAGTTYYLNDPTSGAMEENFSIAAGTTWRDYIIADGHMVALRSVGVAAPPQWGAVPWGSFDWSSFSSPTVVYFTPDHLGSISVVTDAAGHVLERDSYDAWGKRRNPDGTAASCGAIASNTTRGFTGQEMMDSVCYVNFNARVYDPSLGRFMSADPIVGTPYIPQELNRYSYVLNNPLSLTDPSGLCFLGCFWKSPIFDAILEIALVFVLPELEGFTFAALAADAANFSLQAIGILAINAGIAGGIGGYLSTGSLKGALISAGSAAAFAGLVPGLGGSIGSALGGTIIANAAGDFIAGGLIGGLSSVAGGGNFGSGFLAGGVGSLAGPLTGGGFSPQGVLASVVLGGFASVLGGGKFANGAITGAFAYAAEIEAESGSSGDARYASNDTRMCDWGPCEPEAVTVTAHRATIYYYPFGVTHLALGLNGHPPRGHWPAQSQRFRETFGMVPGVTNYDYLHGENPASAETFTFNITATQYNALVNYYATYGNEDYNTLTMNCAEFVEGALNAAGIAVPMDVLPSAAFTDIHSVVETGRPIDWYGGMKY